jgi:acyl-coenzyme A thioesterase PaaI-like protein
MATTTSTDSMDRSDTASTASQPSIGDLPGNPVDIPVDTPAPGTPPTEPAGGARKPIARKNAQPVKVTWVDKVEAFVSRLSTRDNFWHSICSFIWLPLAFFSGIRTRKLDADTYAAYLPFRRFNRNWYRAMAGGALLGNAEIAGGMYVFGICGSDYTVVCKNLNYTFLRPCLGPAVYRMNARENIRELVHGGGEFNCTLDMDVMQQPINTKDRERRVGKCEVTFHVTPKVHHKMKAMRKRK